MFLPNYPERISSVPPGGSFSRDVVGRCPIRVRGEIVDELYSAKSLRKSENKPAQTPLTNQPLNSQYPKSAMLFEWYVQAFPSGHVGPPATARNKSWHGKGLRKRRWHGWSSSKEVEVCLVNVLCYTCVGAPLQASRVSLSHAYGLRASSEHARQTPTYTFFTTASSRRNTGAGFSHDDFAHAHHHTHGPRLA